jgi:hypothetical protein
MTSSWTEKVTAWRQDISDKLHKTFNVHSNYDLIQLDEQTKGLADRGAIIYDYAWSSCLHHLLIHTSVGFVVGATCSLLFLKSIVI